MKIFTYAEARQHPARVFDAARSGDVLIRTTQGETFTLRLAEGDDAPLDIPTVKTRATTQDAIEAIREARERDAGLGASHAPAPLSGTPVRAGAAKSKKRVRSPFDVPGIATGVARDEIVEAVRESRSRVRGLGMARPPKRRAK